MFGRTGRRGRNAGRGNTDPEPTLVLDQDEERTAPLPEQAPGSDGAQPDETTIESPAPDAAAAEELRPDATEVRGTPPGQTPEQATRQQETPAASTEDGIPRRSEGLELIGQYEGSGFKDPPYLARRADGQMIQLPQLLFALAERIDGRKTFDQIAEELSAATGKGLDRDGVRYLVEEKLAPLGVVGADGSSPELEKANPLLALRLKSAVVPPGAVRAVTTPFLPFFFPLIMAAALAALVAFDVWLFGVHGVGQSLRAVLYNPALMLLLFALVVVSAGLHEVGHATALRYGGATPGAMGVGLYMVWPAFYTDVTDAYRLSRWGRIRTDVGGVYFNALFVLAAAGLFFLGRYEAILLLAVLVQLEILQQFMPFLRMDGYYIVSDLTGVPDMFQRIKPILASLIPGRPKDPKVDELKPWVRVVVTVWVLVLVPVLLFNLGAIVVSLPRILATAWDSFGDQWSKTSAAFSDGSIAKGALGVVQMIALALPIAGIVYMLVRFTTRLIGRAFAWSAGHGGRRLLVAVAGAGVVALLAFVWWPGGEYRPIAPGERWTAGDAAVALVHIPSGDAATVLAENPASAPEQPAVLNPTATPSPATTPTPTPSAGGQATPSPTVSPSPTATVTPSPTA